MSVSTTTAKAEKEVKESGSAGTLPWQAGRASLRHSGDFNLWVRGRQSKQHQRESDTFGFAVWAIPSDFQGRRGGGFHAPTHRQATHASTCVILRVGRPSHTAHVFSSTHTCV